MVDSRRFNSSEVIDPVLADFLGPDAGLGGPFAVLGLPHDFASEHNITVAVRRRLLQLDRHPLYLTPLADEVRLAIHTAAAQLADPKLRAELTTRWPPGHSAPMPQAWRKKMDAVSPKLARNAMMIVGASGGWNERAKKRLAYVARAHRVSAFDLVRSIRPEPAVVHGLATSNTRSSVSMELPPEPAASGGMWLGLHATLVVMLAVLMTLIGLELFQPTVPYRPTAIPIGSTSDDPGERRVVGIPGPRDRIEHHAAMEQELANTSLVAAERPDDAAERATRVIGSFVEGWPRMPGDARQRIADGITDLAIQVTQASVSIDSWERALNQALSSENPATQAGGAAMLDFMLANDRIATRARDQLEVIRQTSGPVSVRGFGDVVFRSIRMLGIRTRSVQPLWWDQWCQAVHACGSVERDQRDRMVLEVFSEQLRSVDVPGSRWRPIALRLASTVEWRSGSPARLWMLDQLVDPSVPTLRLAILTEVLATEVSVPGVDVTLVLNENADIESRERLAQDLREAWVAMRAEPSPMQERIVEQLRESIKASDGVTVFRDQFIAIESLARGSAAAALDFEGELAAAGELLEPVDRVTVNAASSTVRTLGASWAERLARSETEENTLSVLLEARGAPMSAIAAEALVDVAFRGPGRTARDRARLMIQARRESAAVLIALEREIGERPKQTLVGLVDEAIDSSFAGYTGPPERLTLEMSSALLARAAEYSGGVPVQAQYAELGYQDALAKRAGLPTGSRPTEALAVVVESWRSRGAETGLWSPGVVMPRLGAMIAVSQTSGQIEAAYHKALVELIAGSLVERAGVPLQSVQRIMLPLRVEWAVARSAAAQMLASQRAEAKLWLLLLESTL